jgi:hypothetical protein
VRAFELVRDEDPSGVSGTGVVAEGVQFQNGKVVVGWLGMAGVSSVAVYDSMEAMYRIHGHEGKTRVVIEERPPTRPEDFVLPREWRPPNG